MIAFSVKEFRGGREPLTNIPRPYVRSFASARRVSQHSPRDAQAPDAVNNRAGVLHRAHVSCTSSPSPSSPATPPRILAGYYAPVHNQLAPALEHVPEMAMGSRAISQGRNLINRCTPPRCMSAWPQSLPEASAGPTASPHTPPARRYTLPKRPHNPSARASQRCLASSGASCVAQ